MHTDDELRAQLIRERASRGRSGGVGDLLNDLRPALRRARRRRIAATTVAATVGLGGLAAAAQVVRTERADTIRVSTDTAPLVEIPKPTDSEVVDPEPSATIAPDPAQSRHDEVNARDSADPGDTDHDTLDDDAADDVVAPSPTVGEGRKGTVDPGQPTATSTTLPEAGPATTMTVTTVTATTVEAQPTPPTTAPAPAAPERFESRCGYVMAIRSSNSVELIEIVPEPGYDYRLEDPDNGAITVQFTGTGEDCELKIPTAGGTTDDD